MLAIVRVQDEKDQVRDYFPAEILAHLYNSLGGEHFYTADEILARKHKVRRVFNTPKVDPNRGAPGFEAIKERWIAKYGK